ncbi:MAG: DUF4347 domain-containing protein, partial [Cyanobacteria bacterium P01_E01_bin.6]
MKTEMSKAGFGVDTSLHFQANSFMDYKIDPRVSPLKKESLDGLVVVDKSLNDRNILLEGLLPGFKAIFIDSDSDGVVEVGNILAEHHGARSLHLLSHGCSGNLYLGNTQLNSETLGRYRNILKRWSSYLSQDATIAIYGCNVASDDLGKSFVRTLSAITQLKIAASASITGASSQGGNWDVEYKTEEFDLNLPFSSKALQQYPHILVTDPFTGISPVDPLNPSLNGQARFTIKQGGKINSSTFKNDSFTIENTGDKRIAAVYFDITDALFPDTVFDPEGLAGDSASRGLTFSNTGGTGAFEPSPQEKLEPFFGDGGSQGYEGMLLTFDPNLDGGYQTGEIVEFGVDVDPNSIVGLPKKPVDINGVDPRFNNWDIGGISGAELINSTAHVLFTDGTTAVAEFIGDGSQGGSLALATQDTANKQATLSVNGVQSGESGAYSQSNIQVTISGDAGDTARINLVKGFIQPFDYIDPDGNPVNVSDEFSSSPYPANNAIEVQTVDILLDGSVQDITSFFDFGAPASQPAFAGNDRLPIGFTSAIVDANGLPQGSVSDPIYLVHSEANANAAPASSGIADVSVAEGAANTVIPLFDAFEDDQDPDTALTYEVVGNSNAAL